MACSQYLGNASFFTITPQDGYFWITELLLRLHYFELFRIPIGQILRLNDFVCPLIV